MRMPRKTSQVIRWHIVAKIIQQKKRVEFRFVAEAKCAA
jgi:hypothetical protein